MTLLAGGTFLMGSESPETFVQDGEGPVREITIDPIQFSKYPVTNKQFEQFVRQTRYLTDAERFAWSFVFRTSTEVQGNLSAPGTPWWLRVNGATWAHPEGPNSSIANRHDHPVVHISWNDAVAYCDWADVRLPTEAEWEFGARGGLEQKRFPWGDELTPGGHHLCNIWQGQFPIWNSGEDGFIGVAPVDSFEPNQYGLHTMIGNTWEWCADHFDPLWHVDANPVNPIGPPSGATRVLKGGSFLCHDSYCNRYRNAARIGNTPDTSTANIGFRVVRDV